MNDHPKLILVRGLPGSGKSSYARALKEIIDPKMFGRLDHFEADMFFIEEGKGYVFKPALLNEAHSWCLESTRQSLKMGKCVVVANTFVKLDHINEYLKLADRACIITMKGPWKSIHGVRKETIDRMRNNWEELPYTQIALGEYADFCSVNQVKMDV